MTNALDTEDPAISIPVGIVVGLLASFVQSLGLTIQRKSHVQNQALPDSERKAEHRRPLWLLGFGIFISSNLFGSIFQIASLPVVILAPLGAVSLLWNAFFARLILGDVFSPWMLLSTLCIAGGAVLIAVFGILPQPNHSLEDLLQLFNRPTFIVYFSLLGFFTIICLTITHAVEYHYSGRIRLPDDTPPLSPLLASHTDPILIVTETVQSQSPEEDVEHVGERTPLLDPKSSRASSLSSPSSISTYLASSHSPLFLAMSYASFSGIIAGMCLLFAKSGVELLVLTLSGKNQFLRWQTWVLVLGLGICALLQLWYMHKSLVLADPTLVCPLAFCFYNLSSIINGLVYFDQFSELSTSHLLFVMLGMAVLLAGVWIVSFPPGGNRGIDLGAWGDLEEIALDEEDDVEELYEDEPLPMVGTQIGSRGFREESIHPIRRSESPTSLRVSIEHDTDGTHADEEPRESPTSTKSSHLRRQTDSALLSLAYGASPMLEQTTPPRRHRPTAGPMHASTTLRPTTPPRQSFSYTHHPLSPGTPSLSGFSIGLSPVSPGFALVPRRRRVTSAEGLPAGDAARRRVVSEGSIGSLARAHEEHRPHGYGSEVPQGASEAQQGARERGRWKLFSSLLSLKPR